MNAFTAIRRAAGFPHRHPFCTAVAVAAAATAAVIAAFLLVVLPILTVAAQVPGDLGNAYIGYYNGVAQQFQQAQQPGGRP